MHSNSKEHGMIFNEEMVRAILSGQKTQTRRIMKSQPYQSKYRKGDYWFSCNKMQSMVHVSDFIPGNSAIPDAHEFFSTCCPFGAIGDRIWVRETFAKGLSTKSTLAYRATHKPEDLEDGFWETIKWTPSIRWASRILLEITNVRVERLNEISNEDAKAEGYPAELAADGGYYDPFLWFRNLWDGIYPEQSFKHNPWVWVIEFKRIEEQSND